MYATGNENFRVDVVTITSTGIMAAIIQFTRKTSVNPTDLEYAWMNFDEIQVRKEQRAVSLLTTKTVTSLTEGVLSHPQVVDGGEAPHMEGYCEYVE